MTDPYMTQAGHLLASPWMIFWARLLGKKRIGYDSGYKCTLYEWRGQLYVTDIKLDTLDG